MGHGNLAKGQRLTPKERTFVEAFVRHPSGHEAARIAGYAQPKANAYGVMQRPRVKAEIARLQAERSERTAIDADYILKELQELYLRFKQSVRPALNSKTGKPLLDPDTGEPLYRFDGQGALKALELMGKHVEVKAFDNVVKLDLDGMTTADRILEGRKRAKQALTRDEARQLLIEASPQAGAEVVAVENASPDTPDQ